MSGWKPIPLGDLLDVQNGYAFSSEEFSDEEGVPLIRIRDLKPNTSPPVKFSGSFDKRYLVNDGDLLIGMDGEFACYEWGGSLALLNQRVCRLVDFSDGIEPRFLLYGINKFLKEIEGETTYTTVKHLSSKTIKEIRFPLPSLDEQKRIVAVLDQAFAALDRARANAEVNLADVAFLGQRVLDEEVAGLSKRFGQVRIGKIARVKGGKRLPKGRKLQSERTPFPYITVGDMTDEGSVDMENLRFLQREVHEAIKNYTVSSKDVYISIAGSIGKTGVVPDELDGANLTENAAKLVLDEAWHRHYVYWNTRSSDFRKQAIDQTRVTAQPKLALQRIEEIKIPDADGAQQQRLVNLMESVRAEIAKGKAAYQEKLDDIAALRQSLLQAAFSGQLA